MKTVVKVPVIESERGWGSKIDDYMICLNVENAKDFIINFNKSNNEDTVPDWYMFAESNIIAFDISENQYEELKNSKDKQIWLSHLIKF